MTTSGKLESEAPTLSSSEPGDGLYEAIDLLQDVFRAIVNEAPGNARAGREAFNHVVRLPEEPTPVTSFQLQAIVRRVAAAARPSAPTLPVSPVVP